jgi:chromosome segregation ATPase
MLGNYISKREIFLNLFVVLLLGCAGKNNPKPVDLYEPGESGNTTTRPIDSTPAETKNPTRADVERRISNVSVNAYRLSNQLKQVKTQSSAARQKKAEVEARLKKVDFGIIQLTQRPTIPEGKVLEYAQKVGNLEQELKQLSQMLGTL